MQRSYSGGKRETKGMKEHKYERNGKSYTKEIGSKSAERK